MVAAPFIRISDSALTICLGVGIFAFLTVPSDAKCGVCAHEIGHLGMSAILTLGDTFSQ